MANNKKEQPSKKATNLKREKEFLNMFSLNDFYYQCLIAGCYDFFHKNVFLKTLFHKKSLQQIRWLSMNQNI